MKMYKTTVVYEGEEIEVSLTTTVEDCEFCGGRGSYVNPAIDGNGISTSDEIWQDDDFREMYRSGSFDEPCTLCGGKGAIWRPDITNDSPMEEKMAYDKWSDIYEDRLYDLNRSYRSRAGRDEYYYY